MYKTIELGSWNGPGFEVPVFMPKVSSRGLIGVDRSDFLKIASHVFAGRLDNIKLASGEIPIHLIAIGAHEAYGFNRNGDGFDEHTCKTAHPRFVKFAKYYANHKNKDPSKRYGGVKLSHYHPTMRRIELLLIGNGDKEAAARNGGLVMRDATIGKLQRGEPVAFSMACKVAHDICQPAGSVVETNKGLLPIEKVRAGMLARTHLGRWREITSVGCRDFAGIMVSLSCTGLPDNVDCTFNHPVAVVRREKLRCATTYRTSKSGIKKHARHTVSRVATLPCPRCRSDIDLEPDWVDADSIRAGDYLVYPIQKAKQKRRGSAKSTIDTYLAGLYVGDGFPVHQLTKSQRRQRRKGTRGLRFSLEQDEHVLPGVRAHLNAQGYHYTENPDSDKNAVTITLQKNALGLALSFQQFFGRGSSTKRIDPRVFNWLAEERWRFLAGCIDSDGSVDKVTQSSRYSTTNVSLAYAVQRLFWGLGYMVCCQKAPIDHENAFAAEGTDWVYTVSIPREPTSILAKYGCIKASDVTPPKRPRETNFIRGNLAYIRVEGVTQKYNELDVYSLTVAEDATYLSQVAVHNCINCLNKAANRSLYCTEDTCISPAGFRGFGCSTGLTKVARDGFMQGVLNPDPHFIDISEVSRPADFTAYGGVADYLQKAASADHVLGGAELAEQWCKMGAEFGLLGPDETMFNRQVVAMVKLARELADIERNLESNQTSQDYAFARGLDPSTQPPMDLGPLGDVGSSKMASGLAALAAREVAIPVRDFLGLMAGEDSEKLAAYSASVPRHLPGIYQRLAADAGLEHALRANAFQPSQDLAPAEQRNWAAKFAATHSIRPAAVQDRVFRSAITGQTPAKFVEKTAMVKTASADEPAEKMARQYALYKLAAVFEMLQGDTDRGALKRMAVRQNYVQAQPGS